MSTACSIWLEGRLVSDAVWVADDEENVLEVGDLFLDEDTEEVLEVTRMEPSPAVGFRVEVNGDGYWVIRAPIYIEYSS